MKIKLVDFETCTGCGVCVLVCPVNSIELVENNIGYKYPKINYDLCINCGKCLRICEEIKNNTTYESKEVFAAASKDQIILKNSSSGGIFSEMAKYILANGGYVFGASMDNNFFVRHIEINCLKDLPLLQGSKYVQSDSYIVFERIKILLLNNNLVLFSGTPCQISALISFLSDHYNNLYLVEIICHGVPNNKIFQDYIINYEKRQKCTVQNYKFRTKDRGWGIIGSVEYKKANHKQKRTVFSDEDSYYSAFLAGLIFRNSCYSCNFATKRRCSDITLGDFWGIQNEHRHELNVNSMNPFQGVSAVLINSNSGLELFENVKENINYFQSSFNKVARHNPQLYKPSERNSLRDTLLFNYQKFGYSSIENQFRKNFIKKLIILRVKNKIPRGIVFKIKKWFFFRFD
ncbi:MAG: Coenzyme F420 hydrogenase/dehydrogenase, beta subunit C-terminal domain [Sphaerochaetaceae bacterium]|nr:Coenzyme F420 hydrogenase/dehydrogenase, beta subunit C-terminal domain [Sphaerochaetaceae bacterium]